VIYIVRNPKDVAVSYYHFLRMASFISYRGRMIDFVNKFIKGNGELLQAILIIFRRALNSSFK